MTLKQLANAIQVRKKYEEKLEKFEKKQELIEKKKLEEFQTKEKKLIPIKKELTKKIFRWVNDFRKTKEYKNLGVDCYIYGGDWATTPPRGQGSGYHSSIMINPNGTLTYDEAWKWVPHKIIIKNSEIMARKFRFDYLMRFWNHLNSGEVYKDLSREVKEQI